MTSNELKHKAKLQERAITAQECRSSGKLVKQWCIENKIKVTTYYRWEREILGDAGKSLNEPERNGTAVFAELPAQIKPYRQVSEQSATLHIGNVSIDIYSGMDRLLCGRPDYLDKLGFLPKKTYFPLLTWRTTPSITISASVGTVISYRQSLPCFFHAEEILPCLVSSVAVR